MVPRFAKRVSADPPSRGDRRLGEAFSR